MPNDLIGAVQRKYKELKLGEPRPKEPRGIKPFPTNPLEPPARMPINAPTSMPLPKGPQFVPPLQREIKKRILPRRILPIGTKIRIA